MKRIPLGSGKFALVDDEDFERVAQVRWTCSTHGKKFYALRFERDDGKKKTVLMHRFILGVTKQGTCVDHVNGDALDNRRCNLRLASAMENMRNRSGPASHNTSGFRGVDFSKALQKWRARIAVRGRDIHLGYFQSKEEAARAFDNAARKQYGKFAGKLNFQERSAG